MEDITQDYLNRKLDSHALEMWLQANYQDPVGIPAKMGACPLQQFLYRAHGLFVEVEDYLIFCPKNIQSPFYLNMKKWAKHFVWDLDDRYSDLPFVTGEQALVVLRDVLRHVGDDNGEEQPSETSQSSRESK